MTTEKKDEIRLSDIVTAIDRVEEYIGGVTKERFLDEYPLQCTVIWQFEIIGEAANHLSPELKDKYSEVVWHEIIGMRNRMIHGYSEIDIDRVWVTAHDDLPPLKLQIEKIFKEL